MLPGKKIPNPLPEPVKKPHREMDFDLSDGEGGKYAPVFHQDGDDDFDYRISDSDDFDIE